MMADSVMISSSRTSGTEYLIIGTRPRGLIVEVPLGPRGFEVDDDFFVGEVQLFEGDVGVLGEGGSRNWCRGLSQGNCCGLCGPRLVADCPLEVPLVAIVAIEYPRMTWGERPFVTALFQVLLRDEARRESGCGYYVLSLTVLDGLTCAADFCLLKIHGSWLLPLNTFIFHSESCLGNRSRECLAG